MDPEGLDDGLHCALVGLDCRLGRRAEAEELPDGPTDLVNGSAKAWRGGWEGAMVLLS